MTDSSTQDYAGAPSRTQRVRGARLEVVSGPATGKMVTAEREQLVIGSAEGCDLVLDDGTVSRFHCELRLDGERLAIRDLGSKNGTLVDRVAVSSAFLHDGATLTLGASTLRLTSVPSLALPLSTRESFGSMLGRSAAMRRAFALLERAATSDAGILLQGETGTGKELAAESVHQESHRRAGPFVVIDCASLPPTLLEAELFGHERGAFTNALHERPGLFECATGGTVFLDEIGELPLELQPKLLRVLERKEVRRVGASRVLPVDVRVVAASNRDLRREVNEKRFRADLFYRLAVVEVTLPPLRDRPEDLPLLVDHLLDRLGESERREHWRTELLPQIRQHSWPGNTRELRNYVERCVALRGSAPLGSEGAGGPERASLLPDTSKPLKVARESWNRELERVYAETLLARHAGNVAAAAREAGVDRMYFYRVLWRHGLR